MVRPEELTGAYVRRVRETLGMSRREFSELCGWPTQTRLGNIEVRDSWKNGNRETLADVINRLTGGQTPGVNGVDRHVDLPEPDDLVLPFDDPDDGPTSVVVVTRLGADPTAGLDALASVAVVAETIPEADRTSIPELPPLPDGAYRVSNGKHSDWKRCRRRWWLSWYRRLEPVNSGDLTSPAAIGTRVHRALAAWYVPEGQSRVDPRDALERAITEDWTRFAQALRDANPGVDDEVLLGEYATKFNQAVALDRAMIEGYLGWLEESGADADYEVVGAEVPMAAELQLYVDEEDERLGTSTTVQVVGLLDARFRRRSDGVRLFDDHKTVGDLTSPVTTLPLNPQMKTYHLIEWLNTPEGEARCDGALYTMIKRVKRTAAARPPFFSRVEVRHNEVELESFKRQLLAATRDMIKLERALDAGGDPIELAYPTPTPDCRWECPFFSVCHMFDDGSHVEAALAGLYREGDPWSRYVKNI